MNHDGLLVNGEGGVGRDGDPIVYVGVSDDGLKVRTWVVGGAGGKTIGERERRRREGGKGVWVRRKGERKGGWLGVGGESEKKKKRVKVEKRAEGENERKKVGRKNREKRQKQTSFKSQWLAGHEHDIGALVAPFHLVVPLLAAVFLPAGAGRKVQAGGLVGGAADVAGADDAVSVGDGEVEQAPRVELLAAFGGDVGDQLVDALDGAQHGVSEHGVAKATAVAPTIRGRARIMTTPLQAVEEDGKGPLAVGAAVHAVEPLGRDGQSQSALDLSPAADVAVVHPQQATVSEGVAVAVGERAFGRGSHVGEDERRRRLGRQPFQVDAVPRRDCRREDARFRPQRGRRVIAYPESVAVVGTSGILPKREKRGGGFY